MVGVRLTVAYDGADFAGWASQPGQRTVQGVLEATIAEMAGHEVEVRGAGRTDAGVHAEAQVAAFDTTRTQIPPHGWLLGLNGALPPDLAVREVALCAPGYAPRFDAVDKTYRYLVLTDGARDPLWRGRTWFVPETLDLAAMRDAAARLVGTFDFNALRAANDGRTNTVRTLHELTVTSGYAGVPAIVAIEVRGSAFLKQMVRILAGTLVDVGRGRRAASSLDALLGPGARREDAGVTAPAHGLTMVRVKLGRAAPPADR